MTRESEEKNITSPEEPVHEATTPPGSGEQDEKATERAKEKLDEAGGGH